MAFWNKLDRPATPATDPQPHETTPRATPAPAQPTNQAVPQPAAQKEEWKPMAMKREDVATSVGGPSDLLLGHGAEFEGKLTFSGTVRIDAKFKGSIVTDDVLVVGEHARIDADITCGTVIVYGEVNGDIKAKTAVELHHPAKLRGNVETPSLMIEKGVVFQGESRMDKSAPARPATVKPATTSTAAPPAVPN